MQTVAARLLRSCGRAAHSLEGGHRRRDCFATLDGSGGAYLYELAASQNRRYRVSSNRCRPPTT